MSKQEQKLYPLYKDYYNLDFSNISKLISNIPSNNKIHKQKPPTIKQFIQKINLKYHYEYYLIEEDWKKNEELNLLTDYFTESERIKCNFRNKMSPLDYFDVHYDEINNAFKLSKISKKTHLVKNLDIIKFKDYMFNKIKFCNNFRISIALTILGIFKPKRWLDMSAGWGDRLIASILYGVDEYLGVDPNPGLQEGYNKIIDTLVDNDKKQNFQVIHSGFENANLPNKKYDLVFTSPPFFDFEVYSSDENDSLVKYDTLEKWYNGFLMTSINKAIEYISMYGTLILYIDFEDKDYIKRLVDDVSNKLKFLGCIYYFDDIKKPKPRAFYVWKKLNE